MHLNVPIWSESWMLLATRWYPPLQSGNKKMIEPIGTSLFDFCRLSWFLKHLTYQHALSLWICKGCFYMIHHTSWIGPRDMLSNNPFLVSLSGVWVNCHSSSTFHIARQNTSSSQTLSGRTLHTFLVNCCGISAFSRAYLDLLCPHNSQHIHMCYLHIKSIF